MRSLLLALLLVSACCTTRPVPEAPKADVALAYMIQHTYQVDVDCPGDKDDGGGSAVDIGDGFAITAKHVVDPFYLGCNITLNRDDGFSITEYEVEVHPNTDMALVRTPQFVGPVVPFATPDLGLDVIAVGYPSNAYGDGYQELGVTKGNVAGRPDREGDVRFSAPIWHGNSGGGVWTTDGRLVGLSVSMILNRPNWFYLVPASRVRDLM